MVLRDNFGLKLGVVRRAHHERLGRRTPLSLRDLVHERRGGFQTRPYISEARFARAARLIFQVDVTAAAAPFPH